ncbi:MAG: DUF1353 domain-containing protein [Burkholderiaceae bacterium]|nr:DUF1353 domain-containing protein [Burkholderiaceae bacterium]
MAIACAAAPGHTADPAPSASASITPLSIAAIGRDMWMLRDPLTLTFSDGAPAITVPAGFVTNLRSIPKSRRWWDGRAEPSLALAILYDYLSWYQPCTQEEAVAVVYHAMATLGTSKASAAAALRTINGMGAGAFKTNAERRRGGEVRTFTPAYTQNVVRSPNYDAGETLESALGKARSAAGLLQQEFASPAVKLTCARLLYDCKACRDSIARKKTPKTRAAKGSVD